MIDLAIAYRIYPGVSKTPAVFTDDKLKLSALCLRSFKKALGSLRVKVWAILDGCPTSYEEMFLGQFNEDELEIVRLPGAGNLSTFSTQVDILSHQTQSDLVYFAEDDYFYLPDALVKMVDFARSNSNVEFLTSYDHPDYYSLWSSERHHITSACGHYWRTSSSTCLTFLASKSALVRTQRHFRTYSLGNPDCSMWLALTQKAATLRLLKPPFDLAKLKLLARTWRWGYRQILFNRSHQLWGPLPSLATHMEVTCLAPLVDWYAEFDRDVELFTERSVLRVSE